MTRLARESEMAPKYTCTQVKEKLASTKWPSSDQLTTFYETHRSVFTAKPETPTEIAALFNYFLG